MPRHSFQEVGNCRTGGWLLKNKGWAGIRDQPRNVQPAIETFEGHLPSRRTHQQNTSWHVRQLAAHVGLRKNRDPQNGWLPFKASLGTLQQRHPHLSLLNATIADPISRPYAKHPLSAGHALGHESRSHWLHLGHAYLSSQCSQHLVARNSINDSLVDIVQNTCMGSYVTNLLALSSPRKIRSSRNLPFWPRRKAWDGTCDTCSKLGPAAANVPNDAIRAGANVPTDFLHHFETKGNHCLLAFTGQSSFEGFLGLQDLTNFHSVETPGKKTTTTYVQ